MKLVHKDDLIVGRNYLGYYEYTHKHKNVKYFNKKRIFIFICEFRDACNPIYNVTSSQTIANKFIVQNEDHFAPLSSRTTYIFELTDEEFLLHGVSINI